MIYCIDHGDRYQPPTFEYSAPTRCLNCEDLFDADDHARLLTEIGRDAKGQIQYVCMECVAKFTCELCGDVRIDVLRIDDDCVCPLCVAALLEERIA